MQRNNHSLRIKKVYYNQINSGQKKLEIRVGYSQIKRIKAGDTITFSDYSNKKFLVERITRYDDFAEMLDTENPAEVIPGVTKYKALELLQEIYPEDKERLGVYVIELRRPEDVSIKIMKASDYIEKNHVLFVDIISRAYTITDPICVDYPKHFTWYWNKTIPAVFAGTREVIVAVVDKKIAGTVFLKNEDGEKKICTILVLDQYRKRGIAKRLLEASFEFLGTTKPLISIADKKLDMFSGIIEKYGWEKTQVLSDGYYNDNSREIVFNGTIE